MTTRLAGIHLPWRALLALPLLALACMVRAGDPGVDSNRRAEPVAPVAPVASNKTIQKAPGVSEPKRAKQQKRSGQSPVGSTPKAANTPIAAAGANAKQDQGEDVPCFKTRLCE